MATLTIRQLDDAVYERLKRDAKANHRSVEAEVRRRLELSVNKPASEGSLADRFRAVLIKPSPDYEGSVALIRSIRDEE